MTIANTPRRAGPFSGTGQQVNYPFAFKIFAAKDIAVYVSDTSGERELASAEYGVQINANQDTHPGGTVQLLIPLPVGSKLSILSAMDIHQPDEYTNAGGFYPAVLNNSLDRLTIYCQQLAEILSRTLVSEVNASGRPVFPAGEAGSLLRWDGNGERLVNIKLSALTSSDINSTDNERIANSAAVNALRISLEEKLTALQQSFAGHDGEIDALQIEAGKIPGIISVNEQQSALITGLDYEVAELKQAVALLGGGGAVLDFSARIAAAEQAITNLQTAHAQLQQAVTDAHQAATSAQLAANTARTEAQSAHQAATSAQQTANTALQDAQSAQTTANRAFPRSGGDITGYTVLRYADTWVGMTLDNTHATAQGTFLDSFLRGVIQSSIQTKFEVDGSSSIAFQATPPGNNTVERREDYMVLHKDGLWVRGYGQLHDRFLSGQEFVHQGFPAHYAGADVWWLKRIGLKIMLLNITANSGQFSSSTQLSYDVNLPSPIIGRLIVSGWANTNLGNSPRPVYGRKENNNLLKINGFNTTGMVSNAQLLVIGWSDQ